MMLMKILYKCNYKIDLERLYIYNIEEEENDL